MLLVPWSGGVGGTVDELADAIGVSGGGRLVFGFTNAQVAAFGRVVAQRSSHQVRFVRFESRSGRRASDGLRPHAAAAVAGVRLWGGLNDDARAF